MCVCAEDGWLWLYNERADVGEELDYECMFDFDVVVREWPSKENNFQFNGLVELCLIGQNDVKQAWVSRDWRNMWVCVCVRETRRGWGGGTSISSQERLIVGVWECTWWVWERKCVCLCVHASMCVFEHDRTHKNLCVCVQNSTFSFILWVCESLHVIALHLCVRDLIHCTVW